MRKPILLGVLFALAVVAALVYSTFGNRRFRCEVCMSYGGQVSCRRASAATKEAALRTATDNACGLIASGVTATMACESSNPVSVRWVD